MATQFMTSGSIIDYEALTQEAMRSLVRTVLTRVAKFGLPGDHHFYVSFDTQAAGVGLSKRLRDRYPQEMTIVLQHRFWDLAVFDDRFEVKLTFDSIPERLVIPFAAIKVFFDPSVRYGLQFEDSEIGTETGANIEDSTGQGNRPPRPTPARKPRPRRTKADKDGVAPQGEGESGLIAPARFTPPSVTQLNPGGIPPIALDKSAETVEAAASGESSAPSEKPGSGAQIVSLDAFRKK